MAYVYFIKFYLKEAQQLELRKKRNEDEVRRHEGNIKVIQESIEKNKKLKESCFPSNDVKVGTKKAAIRNANFKANVIETSKITFNLFLLKLNFFAPFLKEVERSKSFRNKPNQEINRTKEKDSKALGGKIGVKKAVGEFA